MQSKMWQGWKWLGVILLVETVISQGSQPYYSAPAPNMWSASAPSYYAPAPAPEPTTTKPPPPPPTTTPAPTPPAPAYAVPAPYYSAPAPAYAAPAPSYAAPAPSYSAPAPSYYSAAAPKGHYMYYYPMKPLNSSAEPSWGKKIFGDLLDEQKGWLYAVIPLTIVALVVPLVAILLSGITLTTGRSMNGNSAFQQEIDTILHQYTSILESENCVQRTFCELGSYAYNVPSKTYILAFMDSVAPDTMKRNMDIFKRSALYGRDKAKCKTFKCSAWPLQ